MRPWSFSWTRGRTRRSPGFRGHEKMVIKAVFSPDSRRPRVVRSRSQRPVVAGRTPDGDLFGRRGRSERREQVLGAARVTRTRSSRRPSTPMVCAWPRPAAMGRSGCGTCRGATPWRGCPGIRATSGRWHSAPAAPRWLLALGTVRFAFGIQRRSRRATRPGVETKALRPEAERWVERLWSEKTDPAEVAGAIRADRAASEALRRAAFPALLKRARPQEGTHGLPHDPP